jgi:hypothetical protein
LEEARMREVAVKDLIDQLDEETYNLWFATRRFYWITERLGKDVDPERLQEFIRKAEALLEEMNTYGSALDPTYSFEEEVEMLETEVREAYSDLRQALEEALEATLRHRRAKEALETAIAQGITAGEVAGKNAEEREAKARTLYPTLFQALLETEEELTRAKFHLDMAKTRVREVEVLVNLVSRKDTVVPE